MHPTEDITLNGRQYRIDLTSYRSKDLADFSPRASVPGGSVVQSELLLYQPLNITDWRHGLGFQWHTDAMGYMYSMGNIDTRQPGIAMIFTSATQIQDTGDVNGTKAGLCIFNNTLYSWGSTGLRKFSGGAWTSVYSSGAVNFALPTGDYLFFCPNGGRIQKMNTSGVISDAGVDQYATDYRWLCIHKGYIYAGKDGERRIHYASEEDLSDLEGGGPEDPIEVRDPSLINVGAGSLPTLGAISYGQELFVFRKDGVWVLGSDNIARKVLDYSSEQSSKNFRGYCIFNGYLYFSVRSKIFQWNGSRLVDVTPPRITDQFPYSEIKTIGPMLAAGNFMYVIANWQHNPTYTGFVGYRGTGEFTSLFCYDGVGWHKLADLVYSGGKADESAMCYDGDSNKLYISIANITPSSRYDCYFSIGTGNLPSSPYRTGSGINVLLSSRLDMGFRRVKKFSPSLLVEASNIFFSESTPANNRYLSVYAILGMGQNSLGVEETVYVKLGDVKHNGVTELAFPGVLANLEPERVIVTPFPGAAHGPTSGRLPVDLPSSGEPASPYAYNYVILIVEFITANSGQSPILEGLTLRFLLRPNVFYGWNFNIISASNMTYGDNVDVRTSAEILRELRALRDSKLPIDFVDIYGDRTQVYISSITDQAVERHDNQEGESSIEGFINVNLVQCR